MKEQNEFSFKSIDHYDNPSHDDDYPVEEDDEIEEDIEYYTEKSGPAPLDYLVVVQTSVVRPPQVKPVYIIAWCNQETLDYYVSDFPVLKNGDLLPQEERQYPKEAYSSIEDAGKSDYFKALFHVDKALDQKIEDIKKREIDTKYSPHGIRIGASWHETLDIYGETYNKLQPEHREYVQVVSRNGKYTYTASHMSYARQYELGKMYNAFFGDAPKQEYFLKINKIKELPAKYSYFAISFKTLQHQMMNEMLEIGMTLFETAGKKLSYNPLLTSVRGAPAKTGEGQMAEATIDVNSYQRIYVIAVNVEERENLLVSSRSLYLESMPDMYHPFGFNWPDLILKEFSSREEALKAPAYGGIFTTLFKLLDGLKKNREPYIWRNGCKDIYGFSKIVLGKGIGGEQNQN